MISRRIEFHFPACQIQRKYAGETGAVRIPGQLPGTGSGKSEVSRGAVVPEVSVSVCGRVAQINSYEVISRGGNRENSGKDICLLFNGKLIQQSGRIRENHRTTPGVHKLQCGGRSIRSDGRQPARTTRDR